MNDRRYRVEGGARLEGRVRVSGAKNAATKEIVASLMSQGVCIFNNVPRIGDVDATIEIVRSVGAICTWTGPNTLVVDSTQLTSATVPVAFSGVNRIPILLMGPLLHRMGEARVPVLGGCNIGKRPVNFHIDGISSLGADVLLEDGYYVARAKKLKGAIVNLPYPSVGATENVMIAAALAQGTTVIHNAAIEPEIVDLAQFLQSMGAIIYQDVNRTWVIEGVKRLHPAHHTILGDRIETASFAVAAAVTGGNIVVEGCQQAHLMTFLNAFTKVGGHFEVLPEGLRFSADSQGLRPIALETDVHPGFMTDWQQPFVILLTQADGVSVVHETVYEERFGYTRALNEMGARIQLFNKCLGGKECRFRNRDYNHSAVIVGKTPLKALDIDVPDLRAGFSYLIASLLAEGVSTLTNVRYIERGYENIARRFQQLGARLEVVGE
ncbi:MAG: UDP-N-acetylglucosamine 1-carboxyvinyltransferase [Myxococcota bacterium]